MMIHLHAHSNYSFLESLVSPQELAQTAARLEMPALALADHGRLSGAIEFYEACREAGVAPLLGLEIELLPPADLTAGPTAQFWGAQAGVVVLLAQDLQGWGGLCRLASRMQADPAGMQPVPFDLLAENTAGLLCLTGGERGPVDALALGSGERSLSSALERLKEIFPERLYVELQLHKPGERTRIEGLVKAAEKHRLPLAAAQSIYYLAPEHAGLQRTLAAIRTNHPVHQLSEIEAAPSGAHFAAPEEMARRFAAYPRALEATQEIADRCRLELPLGVPHFPQVELPEGVSPIQALRRKAEQGAARLYGAEEGLERRLEHELKVIAECGYEALFLVMEEIVNFARQSGIPIASRGSASSSLVAHCLGITTPDPIRLNLYFERFLNPARLTPPDIDTDLCSRRRDEVIRFVYQRFGAERVAMVCTVNRFRHRSALREVAKAHGLPAAQVSELAESLPQRWYGPPDRFHAQDQPYQELERRFSSPRHQEIFQQAAALIGIPRHLSIHPGGVVISPGQLTDLVPTQMASKGVLITQLDLEPVEKLGLVKIDLLGIRGLTVLGDVAQAIADAKTGQASEGQTTGHTAGQILADPPNSTSAPEPAPLRDPPHGPHREPHRDLHLRARQGMAVLDSIPADDPATADAVEHGNTIGCFQIESPGMRATLREVRARTVDDVMVALALYRPGPLTGGLKDAFVARYRGSQEADYLHTALKPLLADTFGVILYQEQVLRIAHELAGLSLAEADLLRRAMSHFDPGKQMETLELRFIAGAAERSGVPEETGNKVWELMAAFAGYGFPKAHAASYARVAWQSAWCKTHFPALFLAAVLANWGGYYGQRVYLMEARRSGLALHPPHVNYAGPEFSVRYLEAVPTLFMGMNQVRELTHRTQARILKNRPFTSLIDFLARADPRPVEAENLVRAGGLEGLGSIPALLRQLERGGWRGGQLSLFEPDMSKEEDWSPEKKAAAQEAVLGVSVSTHPLELHVGEIAAAGALSTVEAAARLGQRVRVAGARQTWRRSSTTSGGFIYFMSLEDLDGMLDVVIYEEVYRRNKAAFSGSAPFVLEGVVELDPERGEPFIRAERAWKL